MKYLKLVLKEKVPSLNETNSLGPWGRRKLSMNDKETEEKIRNRLYDVLHNLGEKYVQCLDCKHEQGDSRLVCIGRVYTKCIHCGVLFYDSKLI